MGWWMQSPELFWAAEFSGCKSIPFTGREVSFYRGFRNSAGGPRCHSDS